MQPLIKLIPHRCKHPELKLVEHLCEQPVIERQALHGGIVGVDLPGQAAHFSLDWQQGHAQLLPGAG